MRGPHLRTALMAIAVAATACGNASSGPSEAPAEAAGEAEPSTEVMDPPVGAGSGHDRDDDCIQLTQGEFVEIVALDNVFAPECPVLVADQLLRIKNVGVRDHSFTVSQEPNDQTPFLIDMTVAGEETLEAETPLGDSLEPGMWEFFCRFHSGMDGVMEVLEPITA